MSSGYSSTIEILVHRPEIGPLIICGLGNYYQIEQDDCQRQRFLPMSASGAIDIGELSDIPRDEAIGTGIFSFMLQRILSYHFPAHPQARVAFLSNSPRLYREAGVSLIHLGLCSPSISIGQRAMIRR
jgi:hypothetical protein